MSSNALAKSERLKLKNDILQLFEAGKSLHKFPLTLRFLQIETDRTEPVLFSVSVPKRKIKRAVDRNRIKRKIREFYRLNNHGFKSACKNQSLFFNLMFIYASDDPSQIDLAERSLIELLNKLTKKNA